MARWCVPDLVAFDGLGFAQEPAALPAALLAALRQEVDALLAGLQPLLPATDLLPGPAGVGHVGTPEGRSIIRVDGLDTRPGLASVRAWLGSPVLRAWATALVEDPVLTQVDLVLRRRGDGHVIAWHQDAVYPRTHRHAALGLALDDTAGGDGDLLVLPGSQRQVQDLCALEDAHGFAPPGLARIAPRAGDLVIHDAMLVHGSLPLVERPQRRTLYAYVDSEARLRATEPASAAWVAWRRSLWDVAASAWAAFEAGHPHGGRAEWPVDGPPRRRPPDMAGNYCIRLRGQALGNTAERFGAGLRDGSTGG